MNIVYITKEKTEIYKMIQWLLEHGGYDWRTIDFDDDDDFDWLKYGRISSYSAEKWSRFMNEFILLMRHEDTKNSRLNFVIAKFSIKNPTVALQFKLIWS